MKVENSSSKINLSHRSHDVGEGRSDGSRLQPLDYIVMLEKGGFDDVGQKRLVKAAAGRIQAAIVQGQTHFDQMEE